MDRKLINYLPYVVRDYAEFKGISEAEQPEFESAWGSSDDLLNNQFISTAGNLGLSRWEKILGITPKGTDTLEDRRFRILTRLNEELPYTLPQLRNILETLCGSGNYSAEVMEGTYQPEDESEAEPGTETAEAPQTESAGQTPDVTAPEEATPAQDNPAQE